VEKRLYRSRKNRVLWGVCGGLGEYFGLDPVIFRIIAVLLIFANGTGIIAYIIMAIIIPLEGSRASTPKETVRENVDEIKDSTARLGQEIRGTFAGEENSPATGTTTPGKTGIYIVGIILIIVGILALLSAMGWFAWFRWGWPLILVIIGLLILVVALKKGR